MLDIQLMLLELCVKEQRYQAVSLVVLDGESVVKVARGGAVQGAVLAAVVVVVGGCVKQPLQGPKDSCGGPPENGTREQRTTGNPTKAVSFWCFPTGIAL